MPDAIAVSSDPIVTTTASAPSQAATTASPARTPLYACHVAAGARMIEFAGFELPAHYAVDSAPVKAEHMAVRNACGIFDVSHMGQLEVVGPDAQLLLAELLSNDVASLDVGGAQYSVVCDPHGGVLDDVIAYRLDTERYLVVTNAANSATDLAWFEQHSVDRDVAVHDRAAAYAMVAVQGPIARRLVAAVADRDLPGRRRVGAARVADIDVLVAGTGYTGEDGVELLCAPTDAQPLWRELVAGGAQPAGLAARDTLRIEACLPLYGHELTRLRGPLEAGLGFCCRDDATFIGGRAVRSVRTSGPAERLVAFRLDGPGIPRQGNPVVGGGEVTSGTLSPCLDAGIGLAYLPAGRASVGEALQIDVRGRIREATVVDRPFVKRGR